MASKPSLKLVKELALKNESCFRKVDAEIPLMIHPMYASDLKSGVISELEQMMNKSYSKRLGGVPVYYEKVQLLSQMGWIFGSEPYIHIPLRATFYVFSPELGLTLRGMVKKASLNHVGCLIFGLFNVSVLRSQSNETEQWCGDKCKEGDDIDLVVTSLDVTGYTPHILARIVPESIPDHSKDSMTTSITAKPERQQNRRIVFNDEDSGISTTDSTESPEHHVKTKKKNKRRASVLSTSESIDEDHAGKSKNRLHSAKSASECLENQNIVGSVKSKFAQVGQNEDENINSKDKKGHTSFEDDFETEFAIGSEGKLQKSKKKEKKGNKKELNIIKDITGNVIVGSDECKFKNVTSDTKDNNNQKHKKNKKDKDKKKKDKDKKKKDKDKKKLDIGGSTGEEMMDISIAGLFEKEEIKEEKTKERGKKRKRSELGILDSLESSSKSFKMSSGIEETKKDREDLIDNYKDSDEFRFKNASSDIFGKEDGHQKHKKNKDKNKKKKADRNGSLQEEVLDISLAGLFEEESKTEKIKEKGKKRKRSDSGSVENHSKSLKMSDSRIEESQTEKTKKSGKSKSLELGIMDSSESNGKFKSSNSGVEESLNPNPLKGKKLKVEKDHFPENTSEAHHLHTSLDVSFKKKKKKKSLEKIQDSSLLDESKQSPGKNCLKIKDEKSPGRKSFSENRKKHSSNLNTSFQNSKNGNTKPKFNIDNINFDDLPFFG